MQKSTLASLVVADPPFAALLPRWFGVWDPCQFTFKPPPEFLLKRFLTLKLAAPPPPSNVTPSWRDVHVAEIGADSNADGIF